MSINRSQIDRQVEEEQTFKIQRHPPNEDFFVTIRPGAVELLEELTKHSHTFIYSDLPRSEILDITYHLYLQQHPDTDWSDALALCVANIGIRGREDCVITSSGPKKLLGNLSEELDCPINHTWLIDRPNALVDFPCKLIPIPRFNGDMSDRHLFDLFEHIFIN